MRGSTADRKGFRERSTMSSAQAHVEERAAAREPAKAGVREREVLGIPVAMLDDEEMRRALLGSTLVVPDGMPLVWAANVLGEHLPDRVYGPELMRRYNDRCAEAGRRVWLYGGRDQGSLMQLALTLRRRHQGIRIVGGYYPPFRELSGEEEDAVVEQINEAQPDVLWVGIGVPKQEKWMARMRERVEVPVMCGVGAAFDFHSGRISQAPDWMQDH